MKNDFENVKKLYHFTKFDTAILILESQCLRFGRLNDMNDIHENDKLSFVDVSRNQINDFPSNLLAVIDYEIMKLFGLLPKTMISAFLARTAKLLNKYDRGTVCFKLKEYAISLNF